MKTPTILIALACSAVVSLSDALIVSRENSLKGPYEGKTLSHWDLTGSAQISNVHIRLTPDEQNKYGALWNNFPCLHNNWEIQVQFHIHGKGVHQNGNGMAVWYVRDSLRSGPVFGSKDYFSGLGVFIDTFENTAEPHDHRHPYISAVVNNGTFRYEHDKKGTMSQIGGCHVPVGNLAFPTRIALSYINSDVAVYLDTEGLNQWKLCFKSQGVHLPTGYNFGISASTGENSDNHDIISVATLNLDPEDITVWVDKSNVIPMAENVQIPPKYHKGLIEDERNETEQKMEISTDEEEDKQEQEEEELEELEEEQESVEEEEESEKQEEKSAKREEQSVIQEESKTQEETEEESETAEKAHHKEFIADELKKVQPKSDMNKDVIAKEEVKEIIAEEEEKETDEEVEKKKGYIEESDNFEKKENVIPLPVEIPHPTSTYFPTSLLSKLVYILGVIILLLITVSVFRRYNERRKVRMHKRLY